ncbi:MAG: hypothetical protein ABIQ60_06085 [Burkholderiaceae bacterium]
MTSLLIKDLPRTETLSRRAACAVRGGIADTTTWPVEPGNSPGGGVPPLCGAPSSPALPTLPSWMTPYLPGPSQPASDDNTVHMTQHQSATY